LKIANMHEIMDLRNHVYNVLFFESNETLTARNLKTAQNSITTRCTGLEQPIFMGRFRGKVL